MGNHRSGRRRTKTIAFVQSCNRLDIREYRREGYLRRGELSVVDSRWAGFLGMETGRATIFIEMQNPEDLNLRVLTSPPSRRCPQRIKITAIPMRYGGERFYFVCPILDIRCEVLACVGGVFASRQAHRLNYRSNCENELCSFARRDRKLSAKLAPPFRSKPRGANRMKLEALRKQLDFEIHTWTTTELGVDRANFVSSTTSSRSCADF